MAEGPPGSAHFADINKLSDDSLTKIFARVPFQLRQQVLPRVCRKWHQLLCQGSEAWQQVSLDIRQFQRTDDGLNPLRVISRAQLMRWFMVRGSCVRSLSLPEPLMTGREEGAGDDYIAYYTLPFVVRSLVSLKLALRVPPDLSSLLSFARHLTELRLTRMQNLTPDTLLAVSRLPALRSLQLCSRNDIPFPEPLLQLTALTHLHLGNVMAVPAALSALSCLSSLVLGIANLPNQEVGAEAWENLFPAPCTALLGLTQLEASYKYKMGGLNGKVTLPPAFGACLPALCCLVMRHAALQGLQGLAPARRLRRLALSDCALTQLPPALSGLTQLQELDVHTNKITALPDWLATLTSLRSLDVALQHPPRKGIALPHTVTQLTALRRLLACNNDGQAVFVMQTASGRSTTVTAHFQMGAFRIWVVEFTAAQLRGTAGEHPHVNGKAGCSAGAGRGGVFGDVAVANTLEYLEPRLVYS